LSSVGGVLALTVYQVGEDVVPPPAPTPVVDGEYGELGCGMDLADGTRVREGGGQGKGRAGNKENPPRRNCDVNAERRETQPGQARNIDRALSNEVTAADQHASDPDGRKPRNGHAYSSWCAYRFSNLTPA